jgi:hypothetical protein
LRTLSHPLAYLVVLAAAVTAVGLVRAAIEWSRWVVTAAGALGIAGVALTGIAAINLGVSRTCATSGSGEQRVKEINRPAISLFLGGDDCYADAVGQFQIVGVLVVGVSAVAVKRSAPSGRAPSPAAPRV